MKPSQLDGLTRPPHGLLVRSDLHMAGMSRHTWRRAITQGDLVEVMPGVAVVATRPITVPLRMAAAVLSVGPGALLSHRSAAHVWGVEAMPTHPIDVIRVDYRSRPGNLGRTGVVVHRPRDLVDLRPVTHGDQVVTNPLRTLLDLGAVMPRSVEAALQHMRVKRLVTLDDVTIALTNHASPGRKGLGALRAAVASQQLDRVPPDSVLEEHMARLVRRFGLPPVKFHARLANHEVDFWIIGTCLYLECDGWSSHGLKRDQFEYDRKRTAILSAAGFVGIRVTWRQVMQQPHLVAELVWHNIEHWAPELAQ